MVQHTLALVLACLNYDFVGTAVGCAGDNSGGGADDMVSVQLPAAWRPVFLDTNTVDLFFRLFAGLPQSPTAPNLRVLVSILLMLLFSRCQFLTLLSSLLQVW